MEIVSVGYGGVLLNFGRHGGAPRELDLFSAGRHVARQSLIRFERDHAPLANLINETDFLDGVSEITALAGQLDQAGWGAHVGEEWTVTGEDTPFAFRAQIGDFRVNRLDLTRMAQLHDWAPDIGAHYFFSLDMAQHRCGVGLAIEWLDANGRPLSASEAWRDIGPEGGTRPSDYTALVVQDTCPARAASARLVLLFGPPTTDAQAYVFFRNPLLTAGNPADRPIMSSGFAYKGDMAGFAILPIGDAIKADAGPYEIGDGDVRLAVPLAALTAPTQAPPLIVTVNGGYIDITIASGEWTDEIKSLVTIDGALIGHLEIRPGATNRSSLRMPQRLLDGEPHWAELRGAVLGETLFKGWLRFVPMQTPPHVIQRNMSRIERPARLPIADLRYEALLATLERLGVADTVDTQVLAQISLCHALVLKGPQENAVRFERLVVPSSPTPRFSIIIPAHNKLAFTHFCLCSVIYTCAGLSFEIVLVDDGSTDQTAQIETIVDGLCVVRHTTAQGFVGACNAGAAAAHGEFLVFLNNDTETTGRWLEEMALPFDIFDEVGLSGAKLLYPDGRLQEAGGIIWRNGTPWNYGRDGNAADPRYNYTRQVDYMSGAAIMIPRDVWETVGGFSAEFKPAYYEDTDLAFKVAQSGRRVIYTPKSVVVHYEGISNGTSIAEGGLKRYQEINRKTFETKWRRSFARFSEEGHLPDLEKDRGIIGRALVLDYQTPRYDKDAGSYCISQEIRLLQALGYKVTFAPANLAYFDMYTEAIERTGVEHVQAPFYSSIPEVLERRGAEFDLVYVHRYTTGEGVMPLIRQHAPSARVLINCADVHFLREMRAARLGGSQEAFEHALRVREAEIGVFEQADAVLTYSDTERAVIETFLGLNGKVRQLPWVAANPGLSVPLAQRDGVAFVGSYDHPPNRDAMEFFIEHCWPRIRDAHPAATLYLAGTGFEQFKLPVDDETIKIVGWVEDVSQFLAHRRIMVAPLRAGAGMKGKVIDACNSGTPVVLSPIAAEGLAFPGGAEGVIAHTPDDWIRLVCAILSSDELWQRRAQLGLDIIRRSFSFENGVHVFARIFEELGIPLMHPRGDGSPQGFAPREGLRDIDLMRTRSRMRAITPPPLTRR